MHKNDDGELVYYAQHRNLLLGRGYWQYCYTEDGLRYIMGGLSGRRNLLWAEQHAVTFGLITVCTEEEAVREFGQAFSRFQMFKLTDKGEEERAALLAGRRTVLHR